MDHETMLEGRMTVTRRGLTFPSLGTAHGECHFVKRGRTEESRRKNRKTLSCWLLMS